VISRNLPPLRGGMERLNWHLVRELAQAADVAVCGPKGCAAELSFCVATEEAPVRPLSRFLIRNFFQATGLARRIRPNVIVAGSGLTVPTALAAARLCGARVVAYLHGLDIIADHPLYRAVWRRSLRRVDAAIVNSRHTAGLAGAAGIPAKKVHLVHPGVELPVVDPAAAPGFRERFGFEDRPLLLSVGRLTARKGLAEFIEYAMPALVRAEPRLILAIIGGNAGDALVGGKEDQAQRIIAAAERAGVQSSVRLLGVQSDDVVRGAFMASCALIFPVIDLPGDIEGFGMVAVEAAAHGVPTVAFMVGGVVDAVSESVTGVLVRPGDYDGVVHAVLGFISGVRDAEEVRRRREFAEGFTWAVFGEQLRAICLQQSGLRASDAT
jgi:phosphatidylinositol alpha-1,6-mannosyltransferase